MKYYLLLIISVLTLTINAQELSYSDGTITADGEVIETIDVRLDPNVETIKDKFSDWMDDKYDVNLDGKKLLFFDKDFLTANGVVIPRISDRKIDLKVKVDETETGITKLNVFASFGYNNWITTTNHPYEFEALREIVYEFVSEYLPDYYLNKVDATKEKISDLKDDKKDLKNDVADNEKRIADLKKENQELMEKLKINQKKLSQEQSTLKSRTKDFKSIKKRVVEMK